MADDKVDSRPLLKDMTTAQRQAALDRLHAIDKLLEFDGGLCPLFAKDDTVTNAHLFNAKKYVAEGIELYMTPVAKSA